MSLRVTVVCIIAMLAVACGDDQKSGKRKSGQFNPQYANQQQQQNGQPNNGQFQNGQNQNPGYNPEQLQSSANVEQVGEILRERVSFKGIQNDNVPAYLYLPSQQVNGKLPVLMLQYGLGGDKSDGKIAEVAQAIVNRGWAIIVIDIHGVGERANGNSQNMSQGQQITQFLSNFNENSFARYVGDYKKTVDYIESRPELDASRIAYGGASWGSITGTAFVAEEPRIKAFVSIVGGGGFFGLLSDKYDPAKALPRIAPRPVYLINASQDEVILPMFSQAMHNAAGNNVRKKWLDANHTLDGVDLRNLAEDILSFIESALGGSNQS